MFKWETKKMKEHNAFELSNNQIKQANELKRTIAQVNNVAEDKCNVHLTESGVFITIMEETSNVVKVRTIDYTWGEVWESSINNTFSIGQKTFIFKPNKMEDEHPISLTLGSATMKLTERHLFALDAICTLGPGTLITEDGIFMYRSNDKGFLEIKIIEETRLKSITENLTCGYRPKYTDEIVYLESLISLDFNFKIARYFDDYRLARSECILEDNKTPSVPWLLKFKIEDGLGQFIVTHELTCSIIKELMVSLYGNKEWPDIEEIPVQHNKFVKTTLERF